MKLNELLDALSSMTRGSPEWLEAEVEVLSSKGQFESLKHCACLCLEKGKPLVRLANGDQMTERFPRN